MSDRSDSGSSDHNASARSEDRDGTLPETAQERRQERRSYIIGFVLSLLLTLPVFWLVATHALPRAALLWTVAGAALVQMAVHFRWFLHLRFKGQTREDLQLVLFTVLILVMMAGGTIWILTDLAGRMM